MISHRKSVIRAMELLASFGIVAAFGAWFAVTGGWLSAARIETFLPFLLVLVAGTFAIALLLFHECERAIHREPHSRFREQEVSLGEFRKALRWCPKRTKLALPLGILLAIVALVSVGDVEWSLGKPFTEHDAKGFLLYSAIFFLVSLPLLASTSRMPGTFEEHFVEEGSSP